MDTETMNYWTRTWLAEYRRDLPGLVVAPSLAAMLQIRMAGARRRYRAPDIAGFGDVDVLINAALRRAPDIERLERSSFSIVYGTYVHLAPTRRLLQLIRGRTLVGYHGSSLAGTPRIVTASAGTLADDMLGRHYLSMP